MLEALAGTLAAAVVINGVFGGIALLADLWAKYMPETPLDRWAEKNLPMFRDDWDE